MAAIVTPGNMLLGAIISVDHSTVGITESDIIKIQQSKLDYNNDQTYAIIPAGKTLSVDFTLPEKAFVEKIRVYYAPEGFSTFSGIQEVQPFNCFINKVADDTPLVLRDPKDFDDTFRTAAQCTGPMINGSWKNHNSSNLFSSYPNLAFQTGHRWNSLLIDLGLVRPISQFRLYSPYYVRFLYSSVNYNVQSFNYWWQNANQHGEVYASFDGVKFVRVTDLLVPFTDVDFEGVVQGFTGVRNVGDSPNDQDERTAGGHFNNTNNQQPLLCRWLKFNQNGAAYGGVNITNSYNSYGVSEVDLYQYFSETRLIDAIYFRDSELINVAQRYAGYQIPDPTGEPNLRYQDLYIHDITDKIRVNFTAHPSYATWIGSIVASGSYSSLNFGHGASNEVNLLDAPVNQPGTAQPIVINNDSDIIMTDVEITPGFETTSDLQDVIEISEDEVSWQALFSKLGYGTCFNDLGTSCGVGNPDKQYVFKCQQGFQDECSSYVPLLVSTSEETLESAKFQGNPTDGSEVDSWDDNNSTWWSSNLIGPDPAINAWLYDFGAQKFISHIKVRALNNNHTLEVSINGSTWVLPNMVIAGTDQYFKIDGIYRYVRVYAPSANVSEVSEVEIYTSANVYRDKTWIMLDGALNAGVLNDIWYSIGYIPYGEDGDIELYLLRPNGSDYDLIYSSGIITVDTLGIYRHLVDRQILVESGDLIAIYATRCTPQLVVGGGNSSWGDDDITGTVLQSSYSGVGHKVALSAKIGTLLNIGDINPNTSKVVFVRTNIPSALSQAYERDVDLVVTTRTNLP